MHLKLLFLIPFIFSKLSIAEAQSTSDYKLVWAAEWLKERSEQYRSFGIIKTWSGFTPCN